MYGLLIGIGIFIGASNWNPNITPIPPTAALSADDTVQLTANGTIELTTP